MAWFNRRRRSFPGVTGSTLELSGGCGGNYVIWIDGAWNRLSEMWSEDVIPETRFATRFLAQDGSFVLGNLVLNWSTIVADSVKSSWNM